MKFIRRTRERSCWTSVAIRARAVIRGRDYVTPEDLFDLAEDVVLHRIRVSYEASAAGHTGAQVLESILADLG